MITIDQESVMTYYKSLCAKPWTKKKIQNMLTYRKRNDMKEDWLNLKCAYDLWITNHDFNKEPDV